MLPALARWVRCMVTISGLDWPRESEEVKDSFSVEWIKFIWMKLEIFYFLIFSTLFVCSHYSLTLTPAPPPPLAAPPPQQETHTKELALNRREKTFDHVQKRHVPTEIRRKIISTIQAPRPGYDLPIPTQGQGINHGKSLFFRICYNSNRIRGAQRSLAADSRCIPHSLSEAN